MSNETKMPCVLLGGPFDGMVLKDHHAAPSLTVEECQGLAVQGSIYRLYEVNDARAVLRYQHLNAGPLLKEPA